ncbi:hypothetical protein KEM48_013225 [Puccinia striiformis f. sp. tritici PST-130]|nr:hypothetical protein Pst134EB_012882 [Puccinia striiformis f. sp. tritici]KAI9631163.1 hypothetical protein KEM48_013225 [Puccinia striiformis f. sp. tritici PST-130]
MIERFMLDTTQQVTGTTKITSGSQCYSTSESAIILKLKNREENGRNCDPDSGDGILQIAQVSQAMEIIHNSLVTGQMCEKKLIYYCDTKIFQKYSTTQELCDNIAATFQLTHHQLGYEAAPKSLYAGNIQVTRIGDRRPPEETVGDEIVTLIPGLDRIKNVRPGKNVQFIIIIEKQGVFSNLLDLRFTTDRRLGPLIMICPKGQSDIASCSLFHRLSVNPEIVRRPVPFYIFTACDPAGANIALTFKNGTPQTSFEPNIITPKVEWLGVSIEDLKNFPNSHSLIPRLTQTERSKITNLLKSNKVPDNMMQFLQSMQESGEKCKMEKLLAYGSPAAMEGAETGKKRRRHRPINRLYEYILATVIKAGQKSIISSPRQAIQAPASRFQQKTIPTYQTLCFNWEVW